MIEVQYDDGISLHLWYDKVQDMIFAEYEDTHGRYGERFTLSAIRVSKNIYDATGIIFNVSDIKHKFLGPYRNVIVNDTGLHVMRTDRPPRLTRWVNHS